MSGCGLVNFGGKCNLYLFTDSGDPTTFVSHLPIHQDGSCNGLQHYAALGRDVLGAGAVNLLPANEPQDVYRYARWFTSIWSVQFGLSNFESYKLVGHRLKITKASETVFAHPN